MDAESLEKELKKFIEGHTFRMQIATFEHKLEFDEGFSVKEVSLASCAFHRRAGILPRFPTSGH